MTDRSTTGERVATACKFNNGDRSTLTDLVAGVASTIKVVAQRTEEGILMNAIVVTDQAAGTAGMKLTERVEPKAAINDVVVQIHASGFVPTELTWPSTWTDRLGRDRTPAIPGHALAGVLTPIGYGTTGLSVGQRVFGLRSEEHTSERV